jgi:hypothetical protein
MKMSSGSQADACGWIGRHNEAKRHFCDLSECAQKASEHSLQEK